jgi:hypothetical protein
MTQQDIDEMLTAAGAPPDTERPWLYRGLL